MTARAAVTAGAAVLVAAVATVGAVAGCSNQQNIEFLHHTASVVTATPDADGVQRVTIDATSSDRFVPDVVVVHPGRVSLVVRNTGKVPHTLEIPALHVDTGNIGAFATRTVTFTVDRAGDYPFDCAYHVTLHMDGTLQVRS